MFTTHSVEDLAQCDRIVFMARGGRVGFVGTVDEALEQFGVGSVPELYRRLADPDGTTDAGGTAAAVPAPDAGPRDVITATGGERAHAVGVSSPAGRSRRSCATA